jgi:anti-sigma regulatory factor (Ser/Thr protein kinase)
VSNEQQTMGHQTGAPPQTARLALSAEPSAAHEDRRHLGAVLSQARVPSERRHDALLLLSELIANALRHGSREGDPIELVWSLRPDVLNVSVLDCARGPGAPIALTPTEEATEGRGLLIVDRLADEWDERIVGGRRQVSFRLRL